MLKDIVDDYILGNSIVITSATNHGTTSFSLYLANSILKEDKSVIFFNPSMDIDRKFVRKYYPSVYKDALFIQSSLSDFLEILEYIDYETDCIILDPADCSMINKKIIPGLANVLRTHKSTLICTSQIRQNPNHGGSVYSTLESLMAFNYSIWITNVTGGSELTIKRYIDVHEKIRVGNSGKARYIAKFTEEGNVIE